MQPKYVTGKNNQAAKLFREDFYATAPMLEMAIMHIHTDLINDGTPDAYITVKMVKRKMHELLYDLGMSAFKGHAADAKAKKACKEMFPEFYDEMVLLEETTPAEKQTTPPAKKEAPKKQADKPAVRKTSAAAPDFAQQAA
jgi:hypothetical protein